MTRPTPPGARPAVFLDRDGTIIEDRGHLSRPEQVVLFPATPAALRELQQRFLLFIVTNQSGISGGLVTAAEVAAVNRHLVTELAGQGIRITDVYVCPHQREEGCGCMKPAPHFLRQAQQQHGVDLACSFTVGDHPHDVELAAQAGARAGIFVLTGHGEKHRHELPPGTPVAATIAEAVDIIGSMS